MKILIPLLLVATQVYSQPIFEPSFFSNTYIIFYKPVGQSDHETGTAFGISQNNKNYLVTAKHTFKDIQSSGQTVSFTTVKNSRYTTYEGKVFFHDINEIDIAVIECPTFQFNQNIFHIGAEIYIGQECYILGFPYATYNNKTTDSTTNYPSPLLRKGIISTQGNFQVEETGRSDIKLTLMDLVSSPGFSGAPLIVKHKGKKRRPHYSIIGVVSGAMNNRYRFSKEQGEYVVYINHGVSRSFDISYAMEIIKSLSSD